MKKILLVVFITPLLILLSIINLRAEEPDKTVIQFFEASKNGDVETMKRLSAGPFYNRRKALLERNKGYPDYLRKFYSGVTVKTLQSDIGNTDLVKKNHRELYNKHYFAQTVKSDETPKGIRDEFAVVTAELKFPDGSYVKFKFLLKQVKKDTWKIYDEILS